MVVFRNGTAGKKGGTLPVGTSNLKGHQICGALGPKQDAENADGGFRCVFILLAPPYLGRSCHCQKRVQPG